MQMFVSASTGHSLVYIFLAYKAFGLAQAVLQSPNYDVAIPSNFVAGFKFALTFTCLE